MNITVKVANVRELMTAAGVPMSVLAKQMKLSESMVALKIKGLRPMFLDEVGAIVAAVNSIGRTTVTLEEIIKLIGKKNLKVRGFAG